MSADRCDYLCFAWGETDRPCAAIVSDRAAVRQFLIDQWLGKECEELDAAMARFDADSDDGDAWDGMDSIDWQFEIGGVRITKVFAIAAAPAAPEPHIDGWPLYSGLPPAAPAAEPVVATVTECEACFTPDVCQLRGTCDHYAAEKLRVKAAPGATPAQSREPLTQGSQP